MVGNRLKLSNDKTEAVVVGSRRRVSVSHDSHLRVGSHGISFKSRVKGLGVYTDATLSMAKHTDHISRSAYREIRGISSVRHLLTRKVDCSSDVFIRSRLFGLLQQRDYRHDLRAEADTEEMQRTEHGPICSFRRPDQGLGNPGAPWLSPQISHHPPPAP